MHQTSCHPCMQWKEQFDSIDNNSSSLSVLECQVQCSKWAVRCDSRNWSTREKNTHQVWLSRVDQRRQWVTYRYRHTNYSPHTYGEHGYLSLKHRHTSVLWNTAQGWTVHWTLSCPADGSAIVRALTFPFHGRCAWLTLEVVVFGALVLQSPSA